VPGSNGQTGNFGREEGCTPEDQDAHVVTLRR
jgi:hypothetical protein